MCYALAKELEDLGEWERSLAYLKRGAEPRRRAMNYPVECDQRMLEIARRKFGETFLAQTHAGMREEPFFTSECQGLAPHWLTA